MSLCIPRTDDRHWSKLYGYHIDRRSIDVLFRGEYHKAAKNDPSMQRKIGLAGFTEEITDLEIMLRLPCGMAAPEANSSDEVRVYDPIRPGVTRTYKDYRITNVQPFTGPDCYTLTLSLRRR